MKMKPDRVHCTHLVGGAFLLWLVSGTGHTHAAITVYDSRSEFLVATGSLPVGPVPFGSVSAASFSIETLRFTAHTGSSFALTSPDRGIRIGGFDLAINATENFNVESSIALAAFGFDFHEPENDPNVGATFVDSEFEVTLMSGLGIIGSFTFTRPNDSLQFVGFSSTGMFDRIEIREIVGGIDNEFFGNFVQAVPEPSIAVLLLLGLGAAPLRRRRGTVVPDR